MNTHQVNSQKLSTFWKISGPALLMSLCFASLNLIDLFWVSRLDSTAIAAVGIGGFFITLITVIFRFVVIGVISLTSQAAGRGDWAQVHRLLFHNFILVSSLCILLLLAGWFITRDVLIYLHTPAAVMEAAYQYLQWIFIGSPCLAFAFILSGVLEGTGDTITTCKGMVLGTLANFVLDPLLIFGWKFIPSMGIRGTAAATMISFLFLSGFILFKMARSEIAISFSGLRSRYRFDYRLGKKILSIGIPGSLKDLSRILFSLFLISLLNGYGAVAVASFSVVRRTSNLVYFAVSCFSIATTIQVGNCIGAGDLKAVRHTVHFALALAWSLVIVTGFIYFSFGPSLMKIFFQQHPADYLHTAVFMLYFIIFIQIGSFTSVVLNGAFRGMGKTQIPFYLDLVIVWILQAPLLLICQAQLGTIFSILVAGSILEGVCLLYLYFRRPVRRQLLNLGDTL